MPRVTEDQVREVANQPATVDASFAIDIATLLVDEDLATLSPALSDERLRQIELYLAAHFLTLTVEEGPKAAEALGDATERYHNIYAAGLRSTRFGQQAILLDTSGTLAEQAAKAENVSKKDAQFTVV